MVRKTVRVEKEDGITVIVLDRPETKNAVDRETAEQLADAARAFDEDPDALVAVLWGDHGTFCSGADLKAIAKGRPNRVEPEGTAPLGPSRMLLSKPVIAAISGHAVAGGLELALWCDFRVVEEDAVMGVFCRRWGIPLIDGGTVRLPRLVGLSRALDIILTGRAIDAPEALAMGLANRVVPRGRALPVAMELARSLARHPQTCLREDRLAVYEQFHLPWQAALANEFLHGRRSLDDVLLSRLKDYAARDDVT